MTIQNPRSIRHILSAMLKMGAPDDPLTPPAIEVTNLHKSFGETKAVQGVDFTVRQGEIFSLLGPNGAGKTTVISMLSCLLRPDEGDARVMGHSIKDEQMGVKAASERV